MAASAAAMALRRDIAPGSRRDPTAVEVPSSLGVTEQADERCAVVHARDHGLERHRAPEPAVVGGAAVVAEREVVAGRNGDRLREVAALALAGRGVGLVERAAVADDA